MARRKLQNHIKTMVNLPEADLLWIDRYLAVYNLASRNDVIKRAIKHFRENEKDTP